MSAIAIAQIIRKASKSIRLYLIGRQVVEYSKEDCQNNKIKKRMPVDVAIFTIVLILWMVKGYIYH
jgi:hypothetical protein